MYYKKYTYQGISLRMYCTNNNLKYETILKRISTLKNNNPNITDDELVSLAVNQENATYKLFYKGIPLKEFCENNPKYNLNSIKVYLNKEKKKNPELSNEQLIDNYINNKKNGNGKYNYQNIPLTKFCEENNIKYLTVLKAINKFKTKNKDTQLSDDEIVSKILTENYLFYYKGIRLEEYCNNNPELDYKKIKSYLISKKKKNSELTDDEIIDEYIISSKHHGNSKHFYMGTTLKEYCENNNIYYPTIIRAVNRIKERNTTMKYNEDEIISKVLENYIKDEVLQNKCELYHVDYNNVNKLIELEFTNNQAFNIIWYFSDLEVNNYKRITNIKLKEIVTFATNIENNKYVPKIKDIYYLIGIYRCQLYDTSIIIKELLKNPIMKSINGFSTNCNIEISNKQKENIYKEILYNLMHYINYTSDNNYDDLLKGMNITIKAYFRTYLKNNKTNKVLTKK